MADEWGRAYTRVGIVEGAGRDKPGVNARKRHASTHAAEMSRNDGKKDTSASAFRKIDVDQYSDNNFKEEDADGGLGVPTGPDENEILTLLSQYPFISKISRVTRVSNCSFP